jgi:hypothetical protein
MIRGEVTGRKAGCRGYDASRRLALSIPEFCAAHGFSEGMYYKMRKQGLTPGEMKVGTRTLITIEAAATGVPSAKPPAQRPRKPILSSPRNENSGRPAPDSRGARSTWLG